MLASMVLYKVLGAMSTSVNYDANQLWDLSNDRQKEFAIFLMILVRANI